MASTFVLDANVLYSARLRDLWLQLGIMGVARIFWTDAIEAEWIAALERNRPDLRDLIARTVQLIRARFPEAYVPASELPSLTISLPDPDDGHVVRAALATGGVIVTFNIDDFPPDILHPLGVEAATPDAALVGLAEGDEDGVLSAARSIRARLRSPAVSAADFASGVARDGCSGLAGWLTERSTQF